jgi:hypothetical protein
MRRAQSALDAGCRQIFSKTWDGVAGCVHRSVMGPGFAADLGEIKKVKEMHSAENHQHQTHLRAEEFKYFLHVLVSAHWCSSALIGYSFFLCAGA